jgi:hypothetical protein
MTHDEIAATLRVKLTKLIDDYPRTQLNADGQARLVAAVQDSLNQLGLCIVDGQQGTWRVYSKPIDDTDPVAVREAAERRRQGIADPIYVEFTPWITVNFYVEK